MCILKGFSRLVVTSDVQDGFVLESFPFKYYHVEERDFVFGISAINLIVRRNFLACFIKRSTLFLSLSHTAKISSIYLFHILGLVSFCCINDVSMCAMKKLAKETAIFVPMGVPCVFGDSYLH